MPENRGIVLVALNVPDEVFTGLRQEFPDFEFQVSKSKDQALLLVERATILVTIGASKEIISHAKNCQWIQTMSAGVEEFLQIDAIRNNPNLILTNASGIHAIPISEHIFAMVLALTRNLNSVIRNQSNKKWVGLVDERPATIVELYGKNILVVGLGAIGLETAKKAKSFGMKTTALKRNPSKSPKDSNYAEYVDRVVGKDDLIQAISDSDIVVNTLPLTQETEGLFDSSVFSKMKSGSIFVNVGRGRTVVEADLVAALESRKLSGACLDVFEEEPLPVHSPLWDMENVIVSPHIAGWTPKYFDRALEIFRENLRRYSKGEHLLNTVDKNLGY